MVAEQMPDAFHRVGEFLKEWARTRARVAVVKLPRERPDLLVFVLLAATLMLGLYTAVAANGL